MVLAELEKLKKKKKIDPPLKFTYQLNNQSLKAVLKRKKKEV